MPRSGTTLLYQLIISFFNVTYLSNFIVRHHKAPFIADFISNLTIKNKNKHEFKSKYGYTPHASGPSEAGRIWQKWLPKKEDYSNKGSHTNSKFVGFKNFIKYWILYKSKPLVIKNLRFGQRIKLINTLFPEALFIVVEREPLYTLQSIYLAGDKMVSNLKDWCSNESFENKEKAETIYLIYKSIKTTYQEDVQNVSPKRVLEVSYENICQCPSITLEKINDFFKLNGINVENKCVDRSIAFENRNKVRMPENEFTNLKKVLTSYEQ